MSKAKPEKKSVARKKAADAILADRDLEKNPLTAAEIMALPRNQRPPRSEWPSSGVRKNPRPYAKRREPINRSSPSGGGSGVSFFSIVGFLMLWSACSFVMYGAETSLGMTSSYLIVGAIFSGLFSAMVVLDIFKGGSGLDLTRWWW